MPRYWRNKAILAKLETTYGTDAVPTGAANAIKATEVRLEPLVGQDVERNDELPYMGHQGVMLTENHVRLSFQVDFAGSGVAGTAPKFGPLLQACAMAAVITAGTSVVYNPISGNQQAASIYMNLDNVNHVLLGARGNVSLNLAKGEIPRLAFTFTGLLGTIADVPLPLPDTSGFVRALNVNKANTTLSLHGVTLPTERLSIDLGNQIEPRLLINHESIQHVDRKVTGSVVLDAVSIATKNWFQIAQLETLGVLAAQHGMVSGNIAKVDAAYTQIGRPDYGESQKITTNTLPIICRPGVGNDDITLTFM